MWDVLVSGTEVGNLVTVIFCLWSTVILVVALLLREVIGTFN